MKAIVFSITALLLLLNCRRGVKNTIQVTGAAQGTTYHITYLAGEHANYRSSFDSIFRNIDRSLSTYVPGSIISRVNSNESNVKVDDHFSTVFKKSIEVSEKTAGLFDITVAPLVNAYGFGFTKKKTVNQKGIDSLLKFIGYKNVKLVADTISKAFPQVMLDFNAIAQGYTVDVLASFLENKGIDNYLIELGGEIRAKGKKIDGNTWSVGIEQPNEDPNIGTALHTRIRLTDQSLATSGNYKEFYVEDGKKYTHIINPLTGNPAKNNLLSVSVVAGDCMTADAYATAFMVMGLDKAKQFLADNKEVHLEVLFIYDDLGRWKTYISDNFPGPTQEIP